MLLTVSLLMATPAQAGTGGGGDAGSEPEAIAPAAAPAVKTEQLEVPTTLRAQKSTPSPGKQDVDQDDSAGSDSAATVVAELEPTRVKSFKMVGVTWKADASLEDVKVEIRTREDGVWTAWRGLEFDGHEEDGSPRDGTDPDWIGDGADGVAARVSASKGQPTGLRIATIDPGSDANDAAPSEGDATQSGAIAPLSAGGVADGTAQAVTAADTSPTYTPVPKIITRAQWGAAKPKSCDNPRVGATTKGVVIHHTAGKNSYTKAESDNIMRADQSYHMKQRGWCDIGYNFVVDKYGQIFEGRSGGYDRNVRAAHSGNDAVNTYTTGISLQGNFEETHVPDAMKNAVVRLVGWRLATTFNPAKGTYSLGGKTLNRIAGHRNVVSTACPGKYAYAWLGAKGGLRDRVANYIADYKTPTSTLYKKLGIGTTGAVYSGEKVVAGGHRTVFDKADILQRDGVTTAYAVMAPVRDAYIAKGRWTDKLGWPISSYVKTDTGGYQKFQGGRITYTSSTKKAVVTYGTSSSGDSGSTGSTSATKPTTNSAVVPSSRTITVKGRGYGHGIGMSQYGAEGAARKGVSATSILKYYYPGTTIEKKSSTIRVLISADTSPTVTVKSRSGLVYRNVTTKAHRALATKDTAGRTIEQWRIDVDPAKKSRSIVQYRVKGTWHTYGKVAAWTGPAQIEAASGTLGLVLPSSSVATYRGALRSVPPTAGSTDRNTVNVLGLEDYTRGVVAAEVPSSWHAAALRAQAVAARTYGLKSITSSRYYDICDTTACQVYRGVKGETSSTDKAVAASKALVLLYKGKPALAQFSSSSGGRSAVGSEPYLKDKADQYDNWSGNPNHTWSTTIKASAVEKKYPSLGTLKRLTVTARTGAGTDGGRVTRFALVGSKKTIRMTGPEARFGLGLKSGWFTFR